MFTSDKRLLHYHPGTVTLTSIIGVHRRMTEKDKRFSYRSHSFT